MRQVVTLLIIITLGYFATIFGQATPKDSLQTFELGDSIVVIGNRVSTSLKNLAYSYQEIPQAKIRQLSTYSALQAIDMLFPSAYVLENKVVGFGVGAEGAGILNLRGLGGKPNTGVLVLVNGHPDFMGIFGHPLPDVYGVDDIRRVEILAGPASTVFGDHAMGGVVNFVIGPDYKQHVKVNAEGGSFGMFSYGVSLAQKINKHGFYFTVRREKSDGHIPQSSFESFHFLGGWEYRINSVWKASIRGRYVPFKFDDRSRNKDLLHLGAYGDIKRGMAEVTLANNSRKLRGSFQLYTNLGHHEFYDGFKSDDFSYGFSGYQFYYFKPTLWLSGGLDALYYGGKAHNDFALLPNGHPIVNPEAHHLTSIGLYAMAFYSPLPQINLKAGARYQYNSLPVSHVSPFVGFSYYTSNHFQFYANYQTGFRTPTLMELYLFPSANPNLKEESTQSVELGAIYQPNADTRFRVTVFKNRAENLIQTVANPTPPPPARFQNGPNSTPWGVEASARYHVMRNVALQISYGYLNPDLLTAYNPEQQIKYALFLQKPHFYFTLYGKYVGGLYAGNNEQNPLPDYNIVNAQIGLHARNLEMYVRFLNILDRQYYSRPDYPAPGRQARIGIRWGIR